MCNVPSFPTEKYKNYNRINDRCVIFIDGYSGYLKQVILFHKEIFSTFGPTLTLETVNDPQFSSIKFKLSRSPCHPNGNGLAEKAVQIAKNILKKSTFMTTVITIKYFSTT